MGGGRLDEEAEHAALAQRREAMARWLRGFRWSFFATPTFRWPVSEDAARRSVAEWVGALGPRVYAAVAVERGRVSAGEAVEGWCVDGRLHAHVLLGGLRRRAGADAALRLGWRRGRIVVQPYRGRGGAAWYLCKDPAGVDLLGTPQPYRPRTRARPPKGCDGPARAKSG